MNTMYKCVYIFALLFLVSDDCFSLDFFLKPRFARLVAVCPERWRGGGGRSLRVRASVCLFVEVTQQGRLRAGEEVGALPQIPKRGQKRLLVGQNVIAKTAFCCGLCHAHQRTTFDKVEPSVVSSPPTSSSYDDAHSVDECVYDVPRALPVLLLQLRMPSLNSCSHQP